MRKRGERSGEESGRRRTEREYEINREKKGTAGRVIRNIFLSLLILVLLVAAGVYIYGMLYFKDHFFLHTMINGFDASQLTVEEVEEKVADRIADYRLEIGERGGNTETITAEQINYHYVSKGEVQAFLNSQKLYRWPLYMKEQKKNS